MNKKEIQDAISAQLTEGQTEWLSTAHYLFYGGRRTGRSFTLCALAIIEAVFEAPNWVEVHDHIEHRSNINKKSQEGLLAVMLTRAGAEKYFETTFMVGKLYVRYIGDEK